MELDYFTNLPLEITTDILSRLSIRSLAISKSVCKAWLNLLESDDFVKSKIKTPAALIRLKSADLNSTRCTIFEIEDEVDVEKSHDLRYIPLTDFDIPHGNREFIKVIIASGLLLLYTPSTKCIPLYICNPMTREYTELRLPLYIPKRVLKFGFGVSKISGQYKVVCFNADNGFDSHYVYTLGIGTWRRVEAGTASGFEFWGQPILCDDNLHWTVFDSSQNKWICCFDFETECFSIFSLPHASIEYGILSVLRDCLCYSYFERQDKIIIWMIKEYQVDESWTIEYKLNTSDVDFDWFFISIEPIKLFKDGDVLMWLDGTSLFYYSNKTRIIQQVDMFKDADAKGCTLIFNPSLLSLKNFGFENVISF